MKTPIIAAGLLLAALSGAAAAQAQSAPNSDIAVFNDWRTPTPPHKDAPIAGYDRPDAGNRQTDGHQHVVYWSDYFDRMFSFDPQTAADAATVDEIKDKPKPGK